MPKISVKKNVLDGHLGESLSSEQLDHLCSLYGLELDDEIFEKDEKSGVTELVYKIEIPANRNDLLCVEGLARALLIFQKKLNVPHYADGKGMVVDVKSINKKIGKEFTMDEITELLSKMGLSCTPVDGIEPKLRVVVPPTRLDILHECDIAEDIAVAYGFNNITPSFSQVHTVAQPLPMNKLTDLLRHEMAASGWTEVLNFALCSTDDISTKLRKNEMELADVVKISNPKTLEFQVIRKRLLPGLLKTLANNKDLPLPLKLFEIQDVVFIDSASDTKCRNERHLAAIRYSKTGGFEIIHGLLDRVMEVLAVPNENEHVGAIGYSISEVNDSIFFEGRCGRIDFNGKQVGEFGVIHPEVSGNFDLKLPCSYLEMSIEPFL